MAKDVAKVLERAKAMVVPPVDITPFSRRLRELDRKIETLDRQLNVAHRSSLGAELLGVEKFARSAVAERLCAIRNRLHSHLWRLEGERTSILVRGFPTMSFEPLQWRDQQGFPQLALFSVDDPVFAINSEGWIHPKLPRKIQRLYADVVIKLQSMEREQMSARTRRSHDDYEYEIEVRFAGVLPSETRERIQSHRCLFEETYLLAEVARWNVSIKRDPLVLGYRRGKFSLFDSFDVTPLEDYIKAEFTV